MASTFQSSDATAEINSDLCPLGKFGFDPRCRDWYATGHKLYDKFQRPLFITAPYVTASLNVASSATSPIANPSTGEYVGQMLYDFVPSSTHSMFNKLEEPIAFLVSPDDGGTGYDTVIGPGGLDSWEPSSILDLLFKLDHVDSVYRKTFETDILERMKRGAHGFESFDRTTSEGTLETLKLAFQPVKTRVMLPIDPSDFTRGVNRSQVLLYSLGIAYRVEDISEPWRAIEASVRGDLKRLKTIYLCSIVFLSLLFLCFGCFVSCGVPDLPASLSSNTLTLSL